MKYYFAKKLSDLRKSKGLSQEELAEALYVTRQAISKWENGSGIPDIVNIKAIADYFKVSVDALLDDDVDLPINVDNNKDNLIKENNKANDDFKPLSSEPKYYKKDVKSNKLKFQIIQQVAALLGLLFIIIGFFTPFYQFEYSVINYQYSLMDYIFSESNVVFGVLYLFSLVILLLSLGIGDLTFKRKMKHPLLQVTLRPILAVLAIIIGTTCLAMAMPETDLRVEVLSNGAGFYLTFIGITLIGFVALFNGVILYLLDSGKVSEEKLFGIKR